MVRATGQAARRHSASVSLTGSLTTKLHRVGWPAAAVASCVRGRESRLRTIGEHIAGAVVTSLATETILHFNIQFQPHRIIGCTKLVQVKLARLSPLHLAGQLHPSIAIVAQADIPKRVTVMITDEDDTRYTLLHQHDKAPQVTPNVCCDYYHCKRGCIHIEVKTARPVAEGEMLLYDGYLPDSQRTLLVQFDGSYKPRSKQGGAGVAAFLVEGKDMQLIEWQAISIARCPDNIYAETIGCQYATTLAAKWYALLSDDGPVRVTIQGDILPLIQCLNYNARLRYPGIQGILLEIKRISLQQLPCHTYTYLPREGNSLADYLAGEGAKQTPPPAREAPVVNPPLPGKLRSKLQFYQAIDERTLTLDEWPNIDLAKLAAYWHHHPSHRTELCKYIANLVEFEGKSHCAVTYWRTSADSRGRFYAQGPSAQKLPRKLRLLLYGCNHLEIDIAGAFYQIVRRIGFQTEQTSDFVLPPMAQMRCTLERELSPQQPHIQVAPIVKKALHIAMNAPVQTAVHYITSQGLHPTPIICSALQGVRQAAQRTCQNLQAEVSTRREHCQPRNRNFFHF